MSESSPQRKPLQLDASINKVIDLRHNSRVLEISPTLSSAQDWHLNQVYAPPTSPLNSPINSVEGIDLDDARGRSRSRRRDGSDNNSQNGPSEPTSPEDESNFHRSLQIDMKGLVGDAVGNMSVSPSSRDVVLAARRGLFVIDLEAPLEIPRFLPQGGTWDVADVQWNPHPARAEYIVSTSSEKLLIWNLLLVGKTSIEHILRAHYRAITDINWHTTECDTVISTGIDSWLWAWDLREPKKPIFGLSAFESGGTQVKWNRQDANILASSHSNEVFIWDRRKGSLPLKRIRAHGSKIYGIDWAHNCRDELVTCSLDKTIKIWNTSTAQEEPKITIGTAYPVWRARSLPFGHGVLSLPQRGATALELYSQNEPELPVHRFEGHTDVVKEFVWRRGGEDDFQLITWSKDRTLRFWPIQPEIMELVGRNPPPVPRGRDPNHKQPQHRSSSITYRNPPDGTGYLPALSAPVGHRSILAEVRAPLPPRPIPAVASARSQGGTMSRGNPNNISARAPMDAFTWLSNVKVGERRGSSEGAGGTDSAEVSRLREKGANDGVDVEGFVIGEMDAESEREVEKDRRKRSESLARFDVDGNQNQSLQDEITSVLTKLSSSKIKLEKHDLTKKRTCTLGLHGPWGGTSVFIRVTFTFPRDYPQASHPRGTPTVELDRSPLITPKDRAYILRRLTAIREHRRPCLESCLRFLLFRDEEERLGDDVAVEAESSSSEDEEPLTPNGDRKHKDIAITVHSKNLVEPRTSQGIFGPNGELICFFRAPTRIVRNVLRGLSDSPATPAEEPPSAPASITEQPDAAPRMFQSPSLISDAVRRLALSARDRPAKGPDLTRRLADRHNILRTMTNLLTLQPKPKSQVSDGEHRPLGDLLKKSYALLAPRRSTIFLVNTTNFAGSDRKVAQDYIFARVEDIGQTPGSGDVQGLKEVCAVNARAARVHGRYDHERVFKTMQAFLPDTPQQKQVLSATAINVIDDLYTDFAKNKDIQMLAMLSMLLLQVSQITASKPVYFHNREQRSNIVTAIPKAAAVDYFSSGHHYSPKTERAPPWPRRSSTPITLQQQQIASISSSSSSRGSWSSLFNTGSMRQFMSGVQETFRDGLTTPNELMAATVPVVATPIVELSDNTPLMLKFDKMNHAAIGRRRKGSNIPPLTPRSGVTTAPSPTIDQASKSWSETLPQPLRPASSFSSAVQGRAPLAKLNDPNNMRVPGRKRVIKIESHLERGSEREFDFFTESVLDQLRSHVQVYADLLCRWELYHKRLELLKAVKRQTLLFESNGAHTIGLVRPCPKCMEALPQNTTQCPSCGHSCFSTKCTVCRLPVKGLSLSCLQCFHVSHITCWNKLGVPICPSGCGCICHGMDDAPTRPVSRHGPVLSPPSTTLPLLPFT